MNIIFLEIDGVLNSLSTAIALQNHYKDQYFSHVSVGLLKALCIETESKIVITTQKRTRFTTDDDCVAYYKKLFYDNYNWKDFPIIGRTPKLGTIKNRFTQQIETKGYEIDSWQKRYFVPENNFIVIDHETCFRSHQYCRHVQTSFANGFDFIAYNKALNLFGIKHDNLNHIEKMTINHYENLKNIIT